MVLKHIIDENFDSTPRENQGQYGIEFALAFDPSQNLVVQERVAFVPLQNQPPGEYDFQFGIFEMKLASGSFTYTDTDFTHDSVKRFVRPIDRQKVKACVKKAAGYLIDAVKPNKITMHTDETHLPPSAMVKY